MATIDNLNPDALDEFCRQFAEGNPEVIFPFYLYFKLKEAPQRPRYSNPQILEMVVSRPPVSQATAEEIIKRYIERARAQDPNWLNDLRNAVTEEFFNQFILETYGSLQSADEVAHKVMPDDETVSEAFKDTAPKYDIHFVKHIGEGRRYRIEFRNRFDSSEPPVVLKFENQKAFALYAFFALNSAHEFAKEEVMPQLKSVYAVVCHPDSDFFFDEDVWKNAVFIANKVVTSALQDKVSKEKLPFYLIDKVRRTGEGQDHRQFDYGLGLSPKQVHVPDCLERELSSGDEPLEPLHA